MLTELTSAAAMQALSLEACSPCPRSLIPFNCEIIASDFGPLAPDGSLAQILLQASRGQLSHRLPAINTGSEVWVAKTHRAGYIPVSADPGVLTGATAPPKALMSFQAVSGDISQAWKSDVAVGYPFGPASPGVQGYVTDPTFYGVKGHSLAPCDVLGALIAFQPGGYSRTEALSTTAAYVLSAAGASAPYSTWAVGNLPTNGSSLPREVLMSQDFAIVVKWMTKSGFSIIQRILLRPNTTGATGSKCGVLVLPSISTRDGRTYVPAGWSAGGSTLWGASSGGLTDGIYPSFEFRSLRTEASTISPSLVEVSLLIPDSGLTCELLCPTLRDRLLERTADALGESQFLAALMPQPGEIPGFGFGANAPGSSGDGGGGSGIVNESGSGTGDVLPGGDAGSGDLDDDFMDVVLDAAMHDGFASELAL